MKAILAALVLAVAVPALPAHVRAQASDFRVDELQEEVRRLNGRVEELSFQLLQMEERMRKMQEDNEFRFQELEDKADQGADGATGSGDAGGSDRLEKSSGASDAPSPATDANAGTGPDTGAGAGTGANVADPGVDADLVTGPRSRAAATPPPMPPRAPAPTAPNRGAPPKRLGTLTFDAEGNLVADAAPSGGPRLDEEPLPLDREPLPEPGEAGSPFRNAGEATDAAAEYGPTPGAVFARAKTFYEERDFDEAEQAFRAHLAAWPKDPRGPAARYYLGQSLFWQKKYYDAASVLLDTHNAHPQARTAPDTLLALGLSLAGLDQREVACATYAEVLKQYPGAAGRLGPRVRAEQDAARC